MPGLECRSEAGFSFEATLGLTMVLTDFHYDFADVGDTIHRPALPAGWFGPGLVVLSFAHITARHF